MARIRRDGKSKGSRIKNNDEEATAKNVTKTQKVRK